MAITKEDLNLAVEHCNKQLEISGSPVKVQIAGRYEYYAVELYTGNSHTATSLYVLRTGLSRKEAYYTVEAIADTLIYMKRERENKMTLEKDLNQLTIRERMEIMDKNRRILRVQRALMKLEEGAE